LLKSFIRLAIRSSSDPEIRQKQCPEILKITWAALALKIGIAQYPDIQLSAFEEAAAFGDLVVNATSGSGALPAQELAGRANLAGKTLLDISNPLDFSKGMPPTLTISNTDSLGELIQRSFPDIRVVKSLNTVTASLLVNPGLLPEDTHIFLNGNDAGAKDEVRSMLRSFGWKDHCIIDMGDISTARGTEQILPIWVRLWGALQTPMFNFRIVTAKS
jgi:predicted dinucleotide-binding enzyme